MYVCGFRVKAIQYFRRCRVFLPAWSKWGQRDLEIIVAVDKNRKKRGLRTTLILPKAWNYPRPPTLEAWRFVVDGPQDERLFPSVTANQVNGILRTLSAKLGLTRPATYSFRRAYVNRVIPLIGSKGKLVKFTLHFDEAMVDAFYRRTAKEREALENKQ